ncbi:MAG TPA: hypothetical protein VFU81_22415 [Thermomicrobiales bacterium]|nr:hypothetical protein [Thermomicrobiales bacterium]
MRRDELDFLGEAFDPARVGALVANHLRPAGHPPIAVTACELAFARRGEGRQLFQYRVRVRNGNNGAERDELVTALAYAQQNTERLWSTLQARLPPERGAGAGLAPAAYVPGLDILLQTFPFDHRLAALAPIMTGRLPELADALCDRFGPDEWRLAAWEAMSVRYRVDLRATVRTTLAARSAATGASAERRFFVKIYADSELAETAWDAQRRLAQALPVAEPTLAFAPLAAYLPAARVLAHDEVSGAALDELIGDGERALDAVRLTARALAALHRLDVVIGERPQMNRVAPERLEGSVARLQAARPDLATTAMAVAAGIDARLAEIGETPAAPIHGDLKPAHIRLDGSRVVLLDLDKAATGEPMRDIVDLLIRFGRGLAGKRQTRLSRLRRPLIETYFAYAPPTWERRLPPHYAAALLREAAAASESARGGDGSRPGRRINRTDYPGRLLETAQAALTGDA